jgi:hypothetical protein
MNSSQIRKTGTLLVALFAATAALPSTVRAGACCGGGLTSASLITGDERARFGLSFASRSVVADALNSGSLSPRSKDSPSETQNIAALEGSLILADRFQLGGRLEGSSQSLTFPGDFQTPSPSVGLGDIRLNSAYEVLPEWSYSPWKPRGYIWAGVLLPTGRSIHEALNPAEAMGEGFLTPSAGVLFVKRWQQWDATASLELRQSLGRTFEQDLGGGFVSRSSYGSQYGWNGLLALGYSPGAGRLRLGARLEPQWRAERSVEVDGIASQTGSRRITALGADITWMLPGTTQLTAALTDQTALGLSGLASNAALSRTVALLISHRLDR